MKKENRNLKVMLSIGGWTWSANFSAVAGTLEGRNTFARSAVGLMGDWGFDGIDVDWEFPSDQTEGLSFLELLRSVRRELDDYAARQAVDYRFQLSFAAPAGERHYQHLPLREMATVVDNVNLMAYDFAGPWASHTAHTANMYLDELHPESTPYSVSGVVEAYINMGVPAEKLVVGLPLFGRAFEGTQGLGQPFSGVGTGSWEKGAWDYKALPKAGAAILHDDQAQADYTYDGFELISFDTPRTVKEKARFVLQRQLGGLMFWEASADRSDSEALVTTAMRELGSIDRTENLLSYPGSKYANLV